MLPATQDPAIDKPAPAWMVRAVGGLLFCCGIALLVFVVWFAYRVALLGKTPQLAVLVIEVISAAITAFCLFVGYRLVFKRPNRHGSALPPVGWYALGSMFVLLAIGTAAPLLWTAQYSELTGSLCAAVFAAWCFLAAKRNPEKRGDPSAL